MRVAKTYENWEWCGDPFDKNGKLYITVKAPCPRCSGKGIIIARVENGRQIPVQPDGGICYQCGGRKYLEKDVRLYTEAEYERNKEYQEKARKRKEEKREAEMLRSAAAKKKEWLEKNSFNEDGTCFIITGDSYSIKDELKAAGWRFSHQFLWHKPDPAGYEDRVIKLNLSEVGSWTVYGTFVFNEDAADYIKQKLDNALPPSKSEWLEGEKVEDLTVTFVSKREFDGYYGLTNILTFETEEGNVLTWYTSTNQNLEIGENYFISGKIKDRKEFKGIKTTILTRCKIQ